MSSSMPLVRLVTIVAALCWLQGASAYPRLMTACSPWKPGDDAPMRPRFLADGARGNDCVLDISTIPASYAPGETYNFTIRASNTRSLFMVYSSDGALCMGDPSGTPFAGERTVSWSPTSRSGDVSFHGLCASRFTSIYAAQPVSLASAVSFRVVKQQKANSIHSLASVQRHNTTSSNSCSSEVGHCGRAYQACCIGFGAGNNPYPCGCNLADGDGKSIGDCGTCGSAYATCCAAYAASGHPCLCDVK